MAQSIYPAPCSSYWFHVGQLRRDCSHERRCHSLWPNYLGSTQAHRPVGQSPLRILRIPCVCSLNTQREYLRKFSECRERHGRAVSPLSQYSTWASHMRLSRRLGVVSMEDTRQVGTSFSWTMSTNSPPLTVHRDFCLS